MKKSGAYSSDGEKSFSNDTHTRVTWDYNLYAQHLYNGDPVFFFVCGTAPMFERPQEPYNFRVIYIYVSRSPPYVETAGPREFPLVISIHRE